MPKFTVHRAVDAWVVYTQTIEAETPEQAFTVASGLDTGWEEHHTQTFNESLYEVWDEEDDEQLIDEDGNPL